MPSVGNSVRVVSQTTMSVFAVLLPETCLTVSGPGLATQQHMNQRPLSGRAKSAANVGNWVLPAANPSGGFRPEDGRSRSKLPISEADILTRDSDTRKPAEKRDPICSVKTDRF